MRFIRKAAMTVNVFADAVVVDLFRFTVFTGNDLDEDTTFAFGDCFLENLVSPSIV